MLRMAFILVLLLSVLSGARASLTLYDFENPADLAVWHTGGAAAGDVGKWLERAPRFATSGSSSLYFHVPQWQQGMGEWPAFEGTPAVRDWSGYDRLVFDITNASPSRQQLMLFISDSKTPTRSGLFHQVWLSPLRYQQEVIPLSRFADYKINPADIHVVHFFTERPAGDMELYIDRITLLKPGEPLPTPQASYAAQLASLQQAQLSALRDEFQQMRIRIKQRIGKHSFLVSAWAERLLDNQDRQINALAKRIANGDAAFLQDQDEPARMRQNAAKTEDLIRLRTGFEAIRHQVQVNSTARGDIAVGFATSMEKILPRGPIPKLRLSRQISLSLARNERESLQIIVLPCETKAAQVSVRVSELRSTKGSRLPASAFSVAPMGYVQTRTVPPYGSAYVGWWPDPILDFMTAADIAVGDAQSFWLRLHAPKNQAPGVYQGKLEVLVQGVSLYSFDLSVRVYGFTLPDRSPLDMAITFDPMSHSADNIGGSYQDPSWQKHTLQWADFLADYYITYNSLYSNRAWVPDFAVPKHLHKQGRLGRFNLGYFSAMGENPEQQAAWKDDTLKRFTEPYQQAKALGLLDHTYIYGCDENPPDQFASVQRAAEFLKQQFPGVMVMTTSYDDNFGADSALKSIDAFCPLTPSFNADRAAAARVRGRKVWWYICCGPHHPYANMFIEYPAIEGRLLMGAQTAKYRPDGFLYYQISIWNSKPITSGPFTDWDPRSWTIYHGDGSWTCTGPDGTPLPTIRLENFRDGVEDYAYVLALEKCIQQVESSASLPADGQAWLKQARIAAQVPASVSASMTEYTHDPAAVYSWRNHIAEMIETAPVVKALP
jgi:hypothetical protein